MSARRHPYDIGGNEPRPRGRGLPCEICGIKHRYSYPDGQDWDGHDWSPIACSNTVDRLRTANRRRCETCQGMALPVFIVFAEETGSDSEFWPDDDFRGVFATLGEAMSVSPAPRDAGRILLLHVDQIQQVAHFGPSPGRPWDQEEPRRWWTEEAWHEAGGG